MKKRTIITVESGAPMTGNQIVAAIGSINNDMREVIGFPNEPTIQVHGEHGSVYKVQGSYTEEVDL